MLCSRLENPARLADRVHRGAQARRETRAGPHSRGPHRSLLQPSGARCAKLPGMVWLRMLACTPTRTGVVLLSLVTALAAVAGPADAPAQEYVQVEGTVA